MFSFDRRKPPVSALGTWICSWKISFLLNKWQDCYCAATALQMKENELGVKIITNEEQLKGLKARVALKIC
jgi:hypothetical protein